MCYHIGLGVRHTYSHSLYSSQSNIPEPESHAEADNNGKPSGIDSPNNISSLDAGSITGGSEADLSTDEDCNDDNFGGDNWEGSEDLWSHHSEESDDERLSKEEMYGNK